MGVPQYGILTTGTGMRSFVLCCVQSIDHVSAISVINRNRLILHIQEARKLDEPREMSTVQ